MDRVLFLIITACAVTAELPNGWKACRRSDPKFEECFIREITNAVKSIKNGDKNLGTPPIEPLRIEKIQIPKHNSPVSVDLTFTGLDISGITDFQILKASNGGWERGGGLMYFPKLEIIGNYKIDGKVLVLPILGEGKCNYTFYEVKADVDCPYERVNEGGKEEYFQMLKFSVKLHPKRLYLHMDNLFNGDKALGDNMNLFLNENWRTILDELRPPLGEAISQYLTKIANRVLEKIPTKELDLA